MRQKNEETFAKIKGYLNEYFTANAAAPTIRTVSAATGIPRPTVQRYLAEMGRRGEIEYENGHIVTPASGKMRADCVTVPLLGEVACGLPAYEEEHIEMYLRLPRELVGDEGCYLLRARGESMIDAGIEEGDLVLIRRRNTAEAGQIAVVLVEGEVTLKRYYPEPERHRVRLHPENKSMPDIYVQSAVVQGVAFKVIKDLH